MMVSLCILLMQDWHGLLAQRLQEAKVDGLRLGNKTLKYLLHFMQEEIK